MKNIAIIGSTGSIGVQTLNVIRRYPEEFNVVSLSAGNNAELLIEQVREFRPEIATVKKISEEQKKAFPKGTALYTGENAFTESIIGKVDLVVVALVGFTGIVAVLDAINKGKNIALANKESLVVGGELVTAKAKEKGVTILPIDSEHSAIWQALSFDFNKRFKRIILTASGGAFRDRTIEELKSVRAADALKHPTWNMGAKITIDCATLVNKAFEVTEAKWLYNADFDDIDVIIHRESVIHSMVEYEDGSTIAQMSYPTMELPIQIALAYPERLKSAVRSLNFAELGKLTFEELDRNKYPCFAEVLSAVKRGGCYPAAVNGANDTAVELFLKDRISYGDIYRAIAGVNDAFSDGGKVDYENIKQANEFAVRYVKEKFGE
ncbi:MAG: 1-deoxy-D-xylulose-5-phosphate reductoisomerase [Clostridia bacterium]|nr:1-deoxy-D-xylulose-5-phosphate reductoisomerase [Clostridia bacterium]